jgi:CheY-like chemotaxis protein
MQINTPNIKNAAWLTFTNQRLNSKQPYTKSKVLVIEDDVISQRVVQFMLERMSYDVAVVATGKQALAIYMNFDLILSDVDLPDISGIDICSTIRQQTIKNYIPIIALTANDMCKDSCFTVGFNDFMVKPIEYERLQQTIKKYLTTKD